MQSNRLILNCLRGELTLFICYSNNFDISNKYQQLVKEADGIWDVSEEVTHCVVPFFIDSVKEGWKHRSQSSDRVHEISKRTFRRKRNEEEKQPPSKTVKVGSGNKIFSPK